MRATFVLSLLLLAACSGPTPDCVHSVQQFRETLRVDPSLAKVPDRAIEQARAHRDDKSTECVLANGYADDAEEARRHPLAAATPAGAATAAVDNGVPGTPRVHFEITPTPTPPERPKYHPPTGELEPVDSRIKEPDVPPATPAAVVTAAPVVEERPTPNPSIQCRKDCVTWANHQARVACEQRCDGATPLPGSTAPPIITH